MHFCPSENDHINEPHDCQSVPPTDGVIYPGAIGSASHTSKNNGIQFQTRDKPSCNGGVSEMSSCEGPMGGA